MRYAVAILICTGAMYSQTFAQIALQDEIDSLEVASVEIALRMADVEVSRTDLFHRLVPRVTFSASFGTHGLIFGELPVTMIVPNDSYRLTLSFSLDEILNTSRHESAVLARQRQATDVMKSELMQKSDRDRKHSRAKALNEQLLLMREELNLYEKIIGFNQMQFDQGAVKFDVLARSKMQVIGTKQKIGRLIMEIEDLEE